MPLIASISSTAWSSERRFGPFTNCFTFMTGFDDQFIQGLGCKALRPEELGWTWLETSKQWEEKVTHYFSPGGIVPQTGSMAHREGEQQQLFMIWSQFISLQRSGLVFDYPFVWVICFPMIRGASDYHWAIHNGVYWMEQAGRGGPLNVWDSLNDMIEDIYSRSLYVRGSHFFFKKRLE
jgi:hypothetical protein